VVSTGILFALLACAAGYLYRRRLKRNVNTTSILNDDAIQHIETAGWIEVDEPMDLEQIREEEARFWEESAWEEPDEL